MVKELTLCTRGWDGSLKCCLLIRGGKIEGNKRLKAVTEAIGAARTYNAAHTAAVIGVKRLLFVVIQAVKAAGEAEILADIKLMDA